MSLTVGRHFKLEEFEDWRATRPVPDIAFAGVVILCYVALDPLRKEFGLTRVSSGFRTRATNDQVGGAEYSRHVYSDWPFAPAADVQPESGNPQQWADFLETVMSGTGGLGIYSTHVHVDLRPSRARWRG